ncbi:MAG TPA: hypothetical protein VNZ05_08020, partial [Solirubrobacteraceae bacterium]|nr:hypothetical protein [Solirubrobacteraceae bacterium]
FAHAFSARLAGSIRQEPGPASGLLSVDIATTFGGSPSGQLRVVIEGQALSSGGVALNGSHVTLGPSSTPTLYRGRVAQLSGNHIVATVRSADGQALSLAITIQTSPGESSVTGTMSATPVQAPGGE